MEILGAGSHNLVEKKSYEPLMELAPIVLFVYNRPEHTRRTLEALANNDLADKSRLYIFSDGPSEPSSSLELEKITEVRKVIRERNWCKKIHIVERPGNLGLADSIIGGVSEVVNQYGKIIVLEDDMITSPGFLQFMNDALNEYHVDEEVMHISGYMFPIKGDLPETFFFNVTSCWGWGTWQRAWQHFKGDTRQLYQEIIHSGQVDRSNVEGQYDYLEELRMNLDGTIKTWAVKWYASMFLNKGLSLHPRRSLVDNIGVDGSGINSAITDRFKVKKLASSIEVTRIEKVESLVARNRIKQFYQSSLKPDLGTRIKSRIKSIFSN